MPFDVAVSQANAAPPVWTARQHRGRTNYYAGQAAEENVARHLQRAGLEILHRRWRCSAGEIDLIAREGARYVFVEVKAARTHDAAVQRITRRQANRIMQAAQIFLGSTPEGTASHCRCDVALVDGIGAVKVLPNAFMDFCM